MLLNRWDSIREASPAEETGDILQLACGDDCAMSSQCRRFTITLDQMNGLEVVRTTETETLTETER